MELAFQLVEAIRKCTPKSGKYVKSYSVKYELMKNKLLDDFVAEYPLLDDASQDNDLSEEDVSSDEEDGSIDGSNRGRSGSLDVSMKSMSSMDVDDNDEVDKKMELVSLLWSIGFEFIKHFQNLIRPPGGKERERGKRSRKRAVISMVEMSDEEAEEETPQASIMLCWILLKWIWTTRRIIRSSAPLRMVKEMS